jgi:hypothetical protein
MIPHPLADTLLRLCLASVSLTAQSYKSPTARARYLTKHGNTAALVCLEVAQRAEGRGLDPLELIAVSHTESRHTLEIESDAGAVGPLQALAKYWKRPGDPDTIEAGLRAWAYYRARSASTREAAGKYNGGGTSSAYARAVEAHREYLERLARIYTAHRGGAL